MAKRFTDTEKWKDPWFRSLPCKMKVAWSYLCDQCDGVGVWKADLPMLSFSIGEAISVVELDECFGSRIAWLTPSKVWIVGFIGFQYRELNPRNHAHRGIMKRVYQMGKDLPLNEEIRELIVLFEKTTTYRNDPQVTLNRPSHEGQVTPQEEEEEEEESSPRTKTNTASKIPDLSSCLAAYSETLKHFRIAKDARCDEIPIARLVARYGLEKTIAALRGARFEARTDSFDPGKHFSLSRLSRPDIFEKLENLGYQNQPSERRYADSEEEGAAC